MNEKKIGKLQFASIIFLTAIHQKIFTLSYPKLEESGLSGIYIELVYLITILIILLPSYFLLKKSEDRDIITLTHTVFGNFFGKLVILLILSIFVFSTIISFSYFSYFLTNAEYLAISSTIFLLTMYPIVIYACFQGIEGIARVLLIMSVVFCIGIIVIILTTASEIRLINLERPESGAFFDILGKGVFRALDDSVTVLIILLLPKLRGKAVKPTIYSIVFVTVTSSIVLFLTSTIFYKYQEKLSFAFYTLTAMADIQIFRDISTIYISIWTIISFARIAVYMFFIISLIKRLLPQKHSGKALPISIVIFAPILFFLKPTLQTLNTMQNTKFFAIMIPAVVFLLPILLHIGIKIKKKRGELVDEEKKNMDTANASAN